MWNFGTKTKLLVPLVPSNEQWKIKANQVSKTIHSKDLYTNIGLTLDAAIAGWGDKKPKGNGYILSAEASIVLFLILIVMLILNSKAKRKDFSAAREMIGHFIKNKDKRITDLKTQLDEIGFNNNADEQAEKLYEQEKSLIKAVFTLSVGKLLLS